VIRRLTSLNGKLRHPRMVVVLGIEFEEIKDDRVWKQRRETESAHTHTVINHNPKLLV
jgi:hypothetical protein